MHLCEKKRLIAKIAIFDGAAFQTNEYMPNIYLGDPINICNILSDQGCQEINLVFPSEPPHINVVRQILSVSRAPTAVGGFGADVETCKQLLRNGAEKIILSDSLFDCPDSIDQLASCIGAQAITCSIDYRIESQGRFVYTGDGRKIKRRKLDEVLRVLTTRNIGELILSCISNDGSMSGIDSDVASLCNVDLPILLAGGFNGEYVRNPTIDGVVASSSIFLCGKLKAPLINYPAIHSVYHF